jgi:hypothetical protein
MCIAVFWNSKRRRFSTDNPELSSIWFDLGMQEKQHAGLLQFCLVEKMFAEHLPNGGRVERSSALLRSLEKRASNPSLTINDAFAIAAELETSEVNDIYAHLTSTLHTSIYLWRRRIALSLVKSSENSNDPRPSVLQHRCVFRRTRSHL